MAYQRKGRKGWWASGYDPSTGKKRQLPGPAYPNRRAAERAEAEWKTRLRPAGNETCRQFAARWTTDYPRPRESTNLHNAERVKALVRDLGHMKLAAVDRMTARAWTLEHRSSLGAVRAMFGDAVRDGLIQANPFAQMRLPGSRGRADIVALTEHEVGLLADVALHPGMELAGFAREFRAMILFAAYVCLRPGEMFALRPSDLSGELCHIERAVDSKTGTLGPPKNGRARTVTVPPAARAALGDVPAHGCGFLFATPHGQMWTRTSHHYHWRHLRQQAGRPGFVHYELRHTGATMLLERGATPWDVAIQLGHTDGGKLVMELYGHPTEAGARSRLLNVWDDDVKPLRAVGRIG
jgi:integrase